MEKYLDFIVAGSAVILELILLFMNISNLDLKLFLMISVMAAAVIVLYIRNYRHGIYGGRFKDHFG